MAAPGTLFDLSRWHLTTPADSGAGNAEQIDQPELDSYDSEFFTLDAENRMVCTAPVNGFTTSGESGATRTELRERNADYTPAAWDPATTELRQFTITTQVNAEPITGGTTPREEMIFYQIHGSTGTPPMYLAAEYHVETPRVRLFMGNREDGTAAFRDNPVTGLTADMFITVRTEVELGEMRIWIVAGQVADLPATPNYTFLTAELADRVDWYFKAGAYNKTEIASESTGESVARISYLNLVQPGEEPLVNTTRFFLTG